MATPGQPINWTSELAHIGLGAIPGGIGAVMSNAANYANGLIGNYFDKKSEKRSLHNQLKLMRAQYQYAQRYTENTPTWQVTGLRNAGLNPILAATNGGSFFSSVPSSPSATSHRTSSHSQSTYDPLFGSQMALNRAQIDNLRNQGEAALITAKANADRASADVALKTLEKERLLGGANYDNPAVRDAHRTLNHILDSFSSSWDYFSDTFRSPYKNTKGSPTLDSLINYMKHSPKSTPKDKEVFNGLDSLIDALSEALPFRGIRHHLRGSRNRVRSLIFSR